MMINKIKKFAFVFLVLITACGGNNNGSNDFDQLVTTATDSANDRLFVIEQDRIFSVIRASDLDRFVSQPLVDEDHNIAIYNILPTEPGAMQAQAIGDTSRIFISGGLGEGINNQITVLDFDGTSIEEVSFSPIEIGDEPTDLLGDIILDSTNNQLFVSRVSGPSLHVINTLTGEEIQELDLSGNPAKMSLDNNTLYIANNSSDDADKGIMVVSVSNDPLVLGQTITVNPSDDRDIAPIQNVEVLTVGNLTALLALDGERQIVYVKQLENGALRDIEITLDSDEEDEDIDGNNQGLDGELTPANGISSTVGDIILAVSDDGDLFGYVPQADGRIQELEFSATLNTYSSQNLATGNEVIQGGSIFTDPDGELSTVFFASPGDNNLVYIRVGSESVKAKD